MQGIVCFKVGRCRLLIPYELRPNLANRGIFEELADI